MKSGANYVILANLDVDTSKVDKIIFTLRGEKNTLTKTYPEDVKEENKLFSILLYQEDTQALEGTVLVEAQINFTDKAVSKTDITRLYIKKTLATELVEDDTPSGTDVKDVTFEIVGGVVIGKIVGDVDPEVIEKAVQDYLAKHPIEAGITEEEAQALIEAHHDNTKVDVTDSRLTDARTPKAHTHVKTDITDFAHNHDDRYFTEDEITNKLAKKVDTTDSRLSDARTPKAHTHTKSAITDFPTIPSKTSQLQNDSNFLTQHQQLKTINNQSIIGTGNIEIQGGGSGGTTNYNELANKPQINGVALSGNKTSADLSLVSTNDSRLSDSRTPKSHKHVKADITDFPTNVSAFNNDVGYLTDHQEIPKEVAISAEQPTDPNAVLWVDTSAPVNPIDADTLEGHDSSYFATKDELTTTNENVAQINNDLSELDTKKADASLVPKTGQFDTVIDLLNVTTWTPPSSGWYYFFANPSGTANGYGIASVGSVPLARLNCFSGFSEAKCVFVSKDIQYSIAVGGLKQFNVRKML